MSFVTEDGLRRSKRIAKLLGSDRDIIDATLEDAIRPAQSGGRRLRGGEDDGDTTETRRAIKELLLEIEKKKSAAKTALDGAVATSIRSIPYAIGTVATVKAVQNVSVFGTMVTIVRNLVGRGVVAVSSGNTYAGIAKDAIDVLVKASVIGADLGQYLLRSPETAVLLSALIMSYRALNTPHGSVQRIFIEDANAIKDAAAKASGVVGSTAYSAFSRGAQVVTSQMQEYNDAWNKEAVKKTTDILAEIGKNVKPPTGEGASAMTAAVKESGAPAVGGPVGPDVDGMKPRVPAARDYKGALTRGRSGKALPPPRVSINTLASPAEAASGTPSVDEAAQALMDLKRGPKGGRRGRFTKKRGAPRRRLTRRKVIISSYY
jgi:hypothetical protein